LIGCLKTFPKAQKFGIIKVAAEKEEKIMKRVSLCLGVVLFTALVAFAQDIKAGKHKGEVKQLDVSIDFHSAYGQTITDASGIRYCNLAGRCSYENKVYPPEYWGVYAMYYFGRPNGITVTVTNNGPRQVAKLRITTECYVLRTDGTNGGQMMEPRIIDIEVEKGETKVIDASFTAYYTPGLDSGLDRFIVKVSHPNQGGGPGNSDPALIMVKEAVFCPPELEL
jgi:hypothetical protein